MTNEELSAMKEKVRKADDALVSLDVLRDALKNLPSVVEVNISLTEARQFMSVRCGTSNYTPVLWAHKIEGLQNKLRTFLRTEIEFEINKLEEELKNL